MTEKKAGWKDPQFEDQCECCGIRTGETLPKFKSWDGCYYRICADCEDERKHHQKEAPKP